MLILYSIRRKIGEVVTDLIQYGEEESEEKYRLMLDKVLYNKKIVEH